MKICKGILTWDSSERVSKRYGYVWFAKKLFTPIEEDLADVENVDKLLGKKVKITCVVVETRESSHIGDLFLNIKPTTPNVNDKIVLGVGTLVKNNEHIGLKPSDNRNKFWLDPNILYKLHEQTVEVYVEETDEDEVIPNINMDLKKGAISTTDGYLQLNEVDCKEVINIKPNIESLGDGLFAMKFPSGNGEFFEVTND